MTPLKVAVISKSTRAGEGASRVAEQLAWRLNDVDGVVAHHWMAYPAGNAEHGRRLYGKAPTRLFQMACRSFSRVIGLPDFLTPEALYFAWRQRKIDYDILHFHDLSTSFSPIGMRWLARRKPVAWTFHDCSPFTGGCIYPMDCTAYKSRCGRCPMLRLWPLSTRLDFTGFMQAYKRETARRGLFTAIAPSNWMAEESVAAGFFDEPPLVLPYGVDTDCFRPIDRPTVRSVLGLDPEMFTVVLAAGSLGNRHKGTRYAVQALNRLERDVQVLFVGGPDNELIAECAAPKKHVAGSIANDRLLNLYFAASDVYLFPTLADNLPNTVLETMACGTPTIGFRTGGVPDMVENGRTGMLVEQGDVDGLVAALQLVHDNPDVRHEWGANSRAKALDVYSYEKFVENHLRLYDRMLGRNASCEARSEADSRADAA